MKLSTIKTRLELIEGDPEDSRNVDILIKVVRELVDHIEEHSRVINNHAKILNSRASGPPSSLFDVIFGASR